jgi:hypothetical protein
MAAVSFSGNLWAAGLSFLDPRILYLTGAITGALLLGALVLALFDRWRKKQLNPTFNLQDELATYRTLYQRGELSDEEYERVRTQLVERIKKKPKPVTIVDPETGIPVVIKNPTEPIGPKAPIMPKESDTPPSPPPDSPTL